jgi:hypothetical protein
MLRQNLDILAVVLGIATGKFSGNTPTAFLRINCTSAIFPEAWKTTIVR